ncbi:MAG: pyridoxal 5'-phosphate synthase glutaminase subunit PdxT, partial [Chloroflexi bacterium]
MGVAVGVLALQGDFHAHLTVLQHLGAEARAVRLPAQLAGLAGLVIPGGESTTIGKLAEAYGLMQPMRNLAAQGAAIWGTCAGAILLSRDAHRAQPLLNLMDITVQRNAFGRQVDSFEAQLHVPALAAGKNGSSRTFHAIFIRAPMIESVGPEVEVLATLPAG